MVSIKDIVFVIFLLILASSVPSATTNVFDTSHRCLTENSSTTADMENLTKDDSIITTPSFFNNDVYCDPSNKCEHAREVRCTARGSGGFLLDCSMCCPGWTGEYCESPCKKDCGPHGDCYYDQFSDPPEVCLCWRNYTPPSCDILKSDKTLMITSDSVTTTTEIWSSKTPQAVVSPSVVIVLFIVMLLVVPYCMELAIAYYFRRDDDGDDEDDDKTVDAFVSYCSEGADEQFVVHNLRPKLEEEFKFKLCLHFRDFVPGETIIDNITDFLERSRRSILIISPRYLESAYCRFEYQQAHEHMIRLHQKIIPIMFEDIGDTKTDKHLSIILKTVTYEKWPGADDVKKQEKFWRKVLLSMPKKKQNDKEDINQNNIV